MNRLRRAACCQLVRPRWRPSPSLASGLARRAAHQASPTASPRGWSYGRLLEEWPLPTKTLSSGIICASGDLLCQMVFERRGAAFKGGVDLPRTGRFFVVGAALVAPVMHVWFGVLAHLAPGTSFRAVVTKMSIDQLCLAPVFNPMYVTCLYLQQGKLAELPEHLRAIYVDMMVANWQLWPAAQLANFRFVPVPYQVIFSNVVALLWNVYMSWLNSDSLAEPLGV